MVSKPGDDDMSSHVARDDASMTRYYAGRASYYDVVYEKPERAADLAWLKRHLPERFAGRSVIEVACGTGYWTQVLAPVVHAMVSTDLTPEPLRIATAREGTGKVRFQLADAYALPESLGRFDGAFAGLWFSHVPVRKRVTFLQGLHRLLLPGARVVLIDNSIAQCREHPIVERDADGNTWQHRPLRDGSVHRVLKNFPSRAELEAAAGPVATSCVFQELENFWFFEYEIRSGCG